MLSLPLPGALAHAQAAPIGRMKMLEQWNKAFKAPQIAAVLILMYPKDKQTHFVCIKRNTYPGVHSAQISFPGGKFDEADTDLSATALRETFEEIGVRVSSSNIMRQLTELYIPPSNFLVTPFLALSENEICFTPDKSEVDRILEIPLKDILSNNYLTSRKIKTSYALSIEVPGWEIQGEFIWGATAMMLSEVKACINKVLASS